MSRIAARNFWFQVHKWLGLALCALIIPISLTGALLVWHDPLEEMMHPARYEGGVAELPVSRYLEAARPLVPAGGSIQSIALPKEGGAVLVRLSPPPPPADARPQGRARALQVWIDPATARVVDSQWSDAGVTRFLHVFHGSLMVPGLGRQIVGWIGVAMLLSSISGLWLWWPTIGRFFRGLRWRRGRDLDFNLHHMAGFWIALPLAMLSLTGAWISFPTFFGGFVGEQAPRRSTGPGAPPLETPRMSADSVAAAAAAKGRLLQLSYPRADTGKWSVSVAAPDGKPTPLEISDADGSVAAGTPQPPRPPIARLMRRLHDGDGMGIVWQVIIFIGGVIPALLGVTGITMWLRSRRWRSRSVARPVATAPA